MNNCVYMWLIISFLSALIELFSPGLFFFLSFSIGAGVSACIAFFEHDITVQCIIFLGFTIIAFAWLKQLITYKASKNSGYHRTNIEALIGKQVLVCKAIEPHSPGEVKIGSEVWLARTNQFGRIEVGEYVEVTGIRGAHVIVIFVPKKN